MKPVEDNRPHLYVARRSQDDGSSFEFDCRDDRYDFANAHGITPAQLYAWNTILGPNGANCSLEFQAQEYYCIGVSSSSSSSTTSTSSITSTVTAPGPTQSGIASDCNKFAEAKSGDDCYDFANAQGITQAQLYYWNPILGPNGANCSTQFQANEYYCVGVSGSITVPAPGTTATTTSSGAPGPTQSGIAANCNKYAEAKSGDDCYDFAQAQGITTDQLYQWNTVLGANGADCSTQFQPNEYYCVGVSS